jgi:hypothetical protein
LSTPELPAEIVEEIIYYNNLALYEASKPGDIEE